MWADYICTGVSPLKLLIVRSAAEHVLFCHLQQCKEGVCIVEVSKIRGLKAEVFIKTWA